MGEAEAGRVRLSILEGADESSVFSIPQPDFTIVTTRGNCAVFGVDRNCVYLIFVALQYSKLNAIRHSPKTQVRVGACRYGCRAIRVKSDSEDFVSVANQSVRKFVILNIIYNGC